MNFNHESQAGTSSEPEEGSKLSGGARFVGYALIAVAAGCVIYTMAGLVIAIGRMAAKGIVAVSVALAVISALMAVITIAKEFYFADDEAFA